jgi:carboxylate-amine ligase
LRTWVLADPEQWTEVRDRLPELVLEPVAGYGGPGTVVGPACSPIELAQLQAEVAAAPHRFVAREVLRRSTVPTVVDGELRPRPVEMRVVTVALRDGTTRALPAPLTRVVETGAHSGVPIDKDTWILG